MIQLRNEPAEVDFRKWLKDYLDDKHYGKVLAHTRGMRINTYDIDGVVFINKDVGGIYPGPHDFIITGRSFEERPETFKMLWARYVINPVFTNPLPFAKKTRESSGIHKGTVLNKLIERGFNIGCHFEDDEIQAAEIRKLCPNLPVVMIVHDLTNKENVRHVY